jgi:mRNA-decapping enzyme subunit 2
VHLTNRCVIRLAGPDAALFLHNLIPAKILDIGVSTNPIYTAFLSAQGRILNDVFVYPPSARSNGEEWFIEVDEASAGDLLKHLKKHKLRAKFQLEKLDAERIGAYYSWPAPAPGGEHTASSGVGGQDPRPGMGRRWLEGEAASKSPSPFLQHLQDSGSEQTTLEQYTIHRVRNGIAEGQSEIIAGHALPQESNLDLFGGIDFFKGCYLGQELTIRTHHTGVVRKRILPCQLYDKDGPPPSDQQEGPEYRPESGIVLPPPGSNISKLKAKGRGRSSGKWLDGVGNIGLALCRLEMMTDIQLTADCTNFDPTEQYKVQWQMGGETGEQKEVMLKPFVPNWLREGVEASLRRKERKPKREQDDEEEEVD